MYSIDKMCGYCNLTMAKNNFQCLFIWYHLLALETVTWVLLSLNRMTTIMELDADGNSFNSVSYFCVIRSCTVTMLLNSANSLSLNH